ncbi:MAG: DegT/DnrJ/EryC1/StrS family aminotransferase [Desulfovibrionaceae bacterium]
MLPFIDLKAQYRRIQSQVRANMDAVLERAGFILGPENGELEQRLAEYAGVEYAFGCASGTDALVLALMALGVGPGDAVLTTPFTFVATAGAVGLVGATPVFADIDPRTYNVDAEALEAARVRVVKEHPELTIKAVIPVDLFGQPADYDRILPWARKHDLALIVDAAQSFGAQHRGRSTCSLGDIACTSFFPAKPLGCYGDGGACFTHDPVLAELLVSLRVHGQGKERYDNVRLGINGRLDTLQAAVLLAKMDIFEDEILARQAVAKRYDELLAGSGLVTPYVAEGMRSAWAQYSVLAKSESVREACRERLAKAGIPTAVYYPRCLHLQGTFKHLGGKPGEFPVAEDASKRIFSLPMHPYLTAADQERIAAALSA